MGTEQDLLGIYLRNHPEESVRQRRFYNIGAGTFRHPAWTVVDHPSSWYERDQEGLDLAWDAESDDPLPVADDHAEVVYTSHTIEHLTDAGARHLFDEAARILRPGGVLRVTCPDAELMYRAYRDGDRDFWSWKFTTGGPKMREVMRGASIQQLFLYQVASSVSTLEARSPDPKLDDDAVDRLFREKPLEDALDACIAGASLVFQREHPGNHINWFTHDKIQRELRARFPTVRRSAYGQSHEPVLRDTRFFDSTHPGISLYVEAVA